MLVKMLGPTCIALYFRIDESAPTISVSFHSPPCGPYRSPPSTSTRLLLQSLISNGDGPRTHDRPWSYSTRSSSNFAPPPPSPGAGTRPSQRPSVYEQTRRWECAVRTDGILAGGGRWDRGYLALWTRRYEGCVACERALGWCRAAALLRRGR